MFEVPCHQVLYALRSRNGNVQRVARLRLRNRTLGNQCPRQVSGIIRYGDNHQITEHVQSLLSRRGITVIAFVDYAVSPSP
jgi:hypothetical protein